MRNSCKAKAHINRELAICALLLPHHADAPNVANATLSHSTKVKSSEALRFERWVARSQTLFQYQGLNNTSNPRDVCPLQSGS